MALLLTSRDLYSRARELRRSSEGNLPAMMTAASSLGVSAFLHAMKPGGFKILASLGCVGGGGYVGWTGRSQMSRGVGMGFAAGGLWSLLMRSG